MSNDADTKVMDTVTHIMYYELKDDSLKEYINVLNKAEEIVKDPNFEYLKDGVAYAYGRIGSYCLITQLSDISLIAHCFSRAIHLYPWDHDLLCYFKRLDIEPPYVENQIERKIKEFKELHALKTS
jgi:hypothetical protein